MWYLYAMEFYLAIKSEILLFAGKWTDLENIILSEVSQVQKAKGPMFSLTCGIQTQYKYNTDLYKYKEYYEKQVMLRGGHIRDREGKGGSSEGEYGWCTSYTRMNTTFLNLLISP
jgi:hypothetical protein